MRHYHYWLLETLGDGRLCYVQDATAYKDRSSCHRRMVLICLENHHQLSVPATRVMVLTSRMAAPLTPRKVLPRPVH